MVIAVALSIKSVQGSIYRKRTGINTDNGTDETQE
jgi:hypothetical protein